MSENRFEYREPRWPRQVLHLPLPDGWPHSGATISEIEQDLMKFVRAAGPKEFVQPMTRSGRQIGPCILKPQFVPACIRVLWVQQWAIPINNAQSIPVQNYDWHAETQHRRIILVWEPIDCEENQRQRFEGEIYHWEKDRAFGFIKCPACPKVFIHINEIPMQYHERICCGTILRFKIIDRGRGPTAKEVEVVE